MQNDQLIDRLAGNLKPVRPRSVARDAVTLAVVCTVEFVLFLALGAMRPDLPAATEQPSFWWKLISLGLIAVLGGAVTVVSTDPARSPRSGMRWLLAVVVICFAIGCGMAAVPGGFPVLAARVDWRDGVQCVGKIILLSLPAVIGLGFLMKRGAPTDLVGTALTAGIAAAAWGAFVFVFACPYDDPLYIAVWYSVGCGLVIGLARLILPPFSRW